jgi:hypothetical protein
MITIAEQTGFVTEIVKRKIKIATAKFIEPMLSHAVAKLPEGPQRTYELKIRRLSRARPQV